MPRPGWQPPEQYTPTERRFVLMFSGVWLIFLGLPIAAVLTSPDDTPTAKAFGVAMIAAFAATYLASFSWPRPIKPLPLPANTFLQTLLLTAFTALAVPTAGPSITGMVPFIMALWMFTHRVLLGMSVAFIIGLAGTFTVFMLADGEAGFSLIAPIFFAGGILTMFRLAFEHTEVERQYSERVALAEQREELARAVHDALGHSLTSITVQAQLARRLVTADPEAAEKQLDGILSTARDSLRDVRSTVESIDAPGLDEQLAHVRATLQAAGITANVPDGNDLPPLDPAHRRLFSWCLREAVTNVVRHSEERNCRIEVIANTRPTGAGADGSRPRGSGARRTAGNGATLRVIDDGVGIPGGLRGEAVVNGTGLRGLARRAARANATLTLSDADPGTILEVAA